MSFGAFSPSHRRIRDIVVRIASSTGPSLAAAFNQQRRIFRARRWLRIGQGLRAYYRKTPARAAVAIACYRRSLRILGADSWGGSAGRTVGLTLQARLAVAVGATLLLIGTVPAAGWAIFRPDLAAGKTWLASSAWNDFPRSGTVGAASRVEGLFHTTQEPSPSVTIDLDRVQPLHQVVIDNRRDCCRDRALPLALELSADGVHWARVGYRRAPFASWTAPVPGGTAARFVRLRVDRPSILHLRAVHVY